MPKSQPAQSNVGKLIDRGLEAKGFDQSRLADACHVAPSYVTKLRHGEIRQPNLELLMRIAHALGQNEADYKSAHLTDVIGQTLRELGVDYGTKEDGSIRQWVKDHWGTDVPNTSTTGEAHGPK